MGFNDLATVNPVLSSEVSPDSEIKATEITFSSNKKLLWRCSGGHEWEESVNVRFQGRNCPYCSNVELLPGFNDLVTTNPDLAKEVSPNFGLSPAEILAFRNNVSVLWICGNGHEWESGLFSRYMGEKCPYCLNKKVLPGFNDLATVSPDLAGMVSENSPIRANEIMVNSSKKLLWRCDNGHEWESTIVGVYNGNGCLKCSGSKMEENLAQLIKNLIPEGTTILRNDRQIISPYELDIFIPTLGLAFEFNGDYWHSNEMIRKRHPQFASSKQFDDFKKQECKKHGVNLFFVKETQWVNNYEKTVERINKIIAKNLGL